MAGNSPPSSFDPSLYLLSEPPDSVIDLEADPDSFSDDIEALRLQRLETAEENCRKGIVIQHRAWNLSDLFRSDDDIRPVTPSKSRNLRKSNRTLSILESDITLPSTPPRATMTFISSPAVLPPSSPPAEARKRKLKESAATDDFKRRKTVGGFVEEEDDEDQLNALRESYMESEVTLTAQTMISTTEASKMVGGFFDADDDEDELAELHTAHENTISLGFPSGIPRQQSESNHPRNIIAGPFVDDDDDENELDILRDEHFRSEYDPIRDFPNIPTVGVSLERTPLDILSQPGGPGPTLTPTTTLMPNISSRQRDTLPIKTCSGKVHNITVREKCKPVSYERLAADRSTTAPGKAQRSYYGIEIHKLLDDATKEAKEDAMRSKEQPPIQPSIEARPHSRSKSSRNPMWTEKYRARKFADLIGDERTHRSVLRWLKGWDPIVFPGLAKPKQRNLGNDDSDRNHRKILLLTGPPGLGKTTLAHVCAKQAGYEVLEINASDDRSKDVVKGRIRDSLGTENVKSVSVEADGNGNRKAGRPVCVVVDEVDGVVGGSGPSGEGGFIKALIDLVLLDQKNGARGSQNSIDGKKKKGDSFRLLRPLILICNDIYHPSLRPLRTSNIAEVIHVRQVPLENVVQRLKVILERERIPHDGDGVRRLCEASWGLTSRKDRGAMNRGVGEGDIRSVLVSAEWVAHKLRATSTTAPRLTKLWLEEHILGDSQRDGSTKGLGRGGVREIVDRVFLDGAGFPAPPMGTSSFQDPFDRKNGKTPVGVADLRKRHAITKLREMVDTSGEYDRCITDCFTSYPTQTYQDDTFLSKPNIAYDWLHFHDMISSKVFSNQEWELNPYLSQSAVAFHHLFASATKDTSRERINHDGDNDEEEHPFSGPRADFAAFEAQKQNRSILVGFQSSFSAPVMRLFRSLDCVATDLVPNLVRMLSPDVKPVVVRGSDQTSIASVRKESERAMIRCATRVMNGLRVTFEKARVENEGAHGGWVYRMEPPLDTLVGYSKIKGTILDSGGSAPVRYAVRQVLDQEHRKETMRKQSEASQLKYGSSSSKSKNKVDSDDKENSRASKPLRDAPGVRRDFFGRIVNEAVPTAAKGETKKRSSDGCKTERKVWVTFHEGFSNAVRKPISMNELLADL